MDELTTATRAGAPEASEAQPAPRKRIRRKSAVGSGPAESGFIEASIVAFQGLPARAPHQNRGRGMRPETKRCFDVFFGNVTSLSEMVSDFLDSELADVYL